MEVRDLALRAGGLAASRSLFGSLSFDIRSGERWVVLGPNGAGKSSLLAALAGIFPVAGGLVRLQDRRLADWSGAALADWRAWCPQFWSDPFASTVDETARMAMRRGSWWGNVQADDAAVQRMLTRLDLARFAHLDVRRLSGGERQRVAIATALLQDTPLILLDEPASHLDLAHQHMLAHLLSQLSTEGRAVVVSLHDIELAWTLSTHAVLLDGQGGAVAGERASVMTAEHLSNAFGVRVERIEWDGMTRFWVRAEAMVGQMVAS